MSINGIYESERGDALARKSMKMFKGPEPDKTTRFCICGAVLPEHAKWRDGKEVCDGCAEIISKRKREARLERVVIYKTVCTTCGKHIPFCDIVTRNGKKYCKTCGAKETTSFAHIYTCTKCGKPKPVNSMVQRSGKFYCRDCGQSIPKMQSGAKKTGLFFCSVCKTVSTRKKLHQKHGILYCQKCFSHQ